ncbi:MAG: hypothetical protein WBM69_06300 [Desulfobacterales bacterium]
MNIKRLTGIATLILIFAMGCSGDYGRFKAQTGSESKVTQRELIDNWSDYDIWLIHRKTQLAVIIFDPKNDNRKILVGSDWSMVKNQEMWTGIVKANTTSGGDFKLPGVYSGGTSKVNEIWGPDNQLYGFIIYQAYALQLGSVKLVDENTVRLSWSPPPVRGGR